MTPDTSQITQLSYDTSQTQQGDAMTAVSVPHGSDVDALTAGHGQAEVIA